MPIEAAFRVKDGNGKPTGRACGGRGLGMDSLTPPSLKFRWAQPGTTGRGHAQKISMIRNALLLFMLVFFAACTSYEDVVLHDVTDIEVTRFDGKGVAMRVEAVIENPNRYRISAVDPDVDLFLNGTLIGKGLLDSAIVLEKRSTQTYSIPMRAELKDGSAMMLLLAGMMGGEMEFSAKGTIAGQAGIIKKRFPFELNETIDLGN